MRFFALILGFLVLAPAPAHALTDMSKDLKAVLENGTLSKEDCERYRSGVQDQETTLRCGKYMYFFEHLGLRGLPKGLTDLLRKHAPNTVGTSLEKFGLIPDPFSKEQLPVGLAEGAKFGTAATYVTTCAGCHLAKLPDGRYVVGQPNHDLAISKLVLTMASLPELVVNSTKKLPPAAKMQLDPIINEFYGPVWTRLPVIAEAIKLLPGVIATKSKTLNDEQKTFLAELPSGVMDGLFPPVFDDTVPLPQRILPLWEIDSEGMTQAGSAHGAQLSSSGGQKDLQAVFRSIGRTAAVQGGEDMYETHGPDYFKPLEAYISSLKAPKQLGSVDTVKADRGQALFESRCSSCHNGPGYTSTRLFSLEEIGTDINQKFIMDPRLTGYALEDLMEHSEMTASVKALRLVGNWSLKRHLHNGSLSMEELFCLNGPRPTYPTKGMDTTGHDMTCEGLSREEKTDLIEFLKTL